MATEFDMLKLAYKQAEDQYFKACDERNRALRHMETTQLGLQSVCPHKKTTTVESYHRGGYDYCASTNYVMTCDCCKKKLKDWSQQHQGHYG